MSKRCGYCGRENDDAAEACAECAISEFGPSVEASSGTYRQSDSCPICGCANVQPADLFKWRVSGLHAVFGMLGGWVLQLLWTLGEKQRVRCVQCDAIFERETGISKTARVAFIIVLSLIVFGLWQALR